MIKNYFFLNRFIIEAADLFSGKNLTNIFSQEKDKILFEFQNKDESIFLEISARPGDPHLNIRNTYSRARKNTINFFPDLINARFESIDIADDDRIIRIKFNRGCIYYAIRGKFTNVVYVNSDNEITTFKKNNEVTNDDLKSELSNKFYLHDFNLPDTFIESENDYFEDLRNKFPILGKEIIQEVKRRSGTTAAQEIRKVLNEVLIEIRDNKPAVFINEIRNTIFLAMETFGIFDFHIKEEFGNLISAQNFYLSKKHFLSEKIVKLNIVRKQIENDLKKLSSKINNLKAAVERGNKEEDYRKFGSLLLINLSRVKPGMEEIVLEDAYSPSEKIQIKLNKRLSPKKNAEVYFEKSKAERTSFQKSGELLKISENKFHKLKAIEKRLLNVDDLKGLKNIMIELKISDKNDVKAKEVLKVKFKQYIIENKFRVYVGKDSKNNDLLTTKFAKQNDYWFHARSVSGSHVVLRVENTKESIPKNILKKAASLAAYHSKSKTSGLAPVSYTLKKYVVKRKGDPVGTVHLLREDVLLVNPQIPDGCEFITED